MDAIISVVSKFVSEHERPNIHGVRSLMTSSTQNVHVIESVREEDNDNDYRQVGQNLSLPLASTSYTFFGTFFTQPTSTTTFIESIQSAPEISSQ